MAVTLSEIAINSTHLSGNPILVKATTSGIPAGAEEYKILLKIVSADNVLVGSPFIDSIAPDASGIAWFDISGYVHQPIPIDFKFPLSGRFNAYQNASYDIWLYPGESYIDSNGNLQESFGSVLEPFFILRGKISQQEIASYNDNGTNWFDAWCGTGKFLTHQPLVQTIHPKQPVKLWMKWPSGTGATITISTRAYYGDGSYQDIVQTPGVTRASVYELDLQPEHMQFPLINLSGSKMSHFTVQWTGGGITSELRTFRLDWRDYEYCNFLFFYNPIGGIDCVWCKGGVEFGHSTTQVKGIIPAPKGASQKISTIITSKTTKRKWTINTGFKSKEEIAALLGLMESEKVWLLFNAHDLSSATLHPVIVENGDDILNHWSEDLESIDIELTEAH